MPTTIVKEPTFDNLKADAVNIADQIVTSWDGEVDVVLILLPKAGKLTADVAWVSSINNREWLKKVVTGVLDTLPFMKNLTPRILR